MNFPEIMTKGEAAAYSRYSERTIDRWVRRGWLHCFRQRNGQVRFRRQDLDRVMDMQGSEDIGEATLDSDMG